MLSLGSCFRLNQANKYSCISTYNLKINSNTEITAYCSKQAVDENYVKVQIYDKFGSLVQEHNVAKDVQLTLKNGSYVIDSATFDSSNLSSLENTPYFTFKGWKVNNSDIANDTTITVGDYAGSDKILRAQWYSIRLQTLLP